MKKILVLLYFLLILGPVLSSSKTMGQTMGDYTCYPIFMTQSAKPNVMILMSNDHTNFYPGYNGLTNYDDSVDYYGYFDHNKSYKYDGPNYFTPYRDNTSSTNHYVPSGCTTCWSGNFMNWLTMCHGDFVRKALTGGKRDIDSATKSVLIRGNVPFDHVWTKHYQGADLGNIVPAVYNNTSYTFYNSGTTVQVKSGYPTLATFNVKVEVAVNDPANNITPEAYCTEYPMGSGADPIFKPEGLLQRYMDKIHFGLITYSHAKPEAGGVVRKRIGDISGELNSVNGVYNQGVNDTMMRYINSFTQKGWDPTAEMFYEAVKYFKALAPTPEFVPGGSSSQMDDGFPHYSNQNVNKNWIDPFDNWCEKSSIIILNDEYPSKDHDHLPGSVWPAALSGAIPGLNVKTVTDAVGQMEGINGTSRTVGRVKNVNENGSCTGTKNVDTLGNVNGICPTEGGNYGSFYIAGLAWYAFTGDLRSDFQNAQNIRTYSIAFRATPGGYQIPPSPMNQLWLAAKYGNFDDKDGDGTPNLQSEWDADGDGVPDAFYYAEKGSEVEDALNKTFTDILERAASGTAVSVLATSGEGEGNLVQAYFRPVVPSGLTEITWLGYLQSLWVDPLGNLREDTDQDLTLDVENDNVITYFLDTATGDTRIKRFNASEGVPYPDVESGPDEILEMDAVIPLWEAGSRLHQRSADDRKIFTYIDGDGNGTVDESVNDPFDDSGEVVRFHTDSASNIKPYLGVNDSTWDYLGAAYDDRVTNLIQYIRGNDISGLRTRIIDGNVWKLGDIIHSTPVSVSKPSDNFHIIYSDESYQAYYNAVKDRETMVYVGANDGMLHAFTSWEYNPTTREYTKPDSAPGPENIGDELWAYIPQSLLPHLKWLPSIDYTHVYYVDLKPKVFDAKILPDETHYSDGDTDDNWGTILLCGLNVGGGDISAEGDFDYDVGTPDTVRNFSPGYACLDVTDPRNPRLLWERTYTDLEMTTSTPAVVKVKNKWFAVFGSGPCDCDGSSNQYGHIFVVDLKTGAPYQSGGNDWLFETDEDNAFMNSPISLDKNLNYNVDAIYFGESYFASNTWKGKLYKVTVPWADGSGNYDGSDCMGNECTNYKDNPLDAGKPWEISILLDTTRPITAPAALSVDAYDNAWVYAGSGRYLSTEDKSDDDTQYIFGIKDPFYNIEHTPDGEHEDDYYHKYNTSLVLQMSDLLDADDYVVSSGEDGEVFENGASIGQWDDLLDLARAKDGWVRSLTISKERVLNKPAVLGGIIFTTSYVPNDDICGFGGDSYLYGLYYETGTAYYEPVFTGGTTTAQVGGEDVEQVLDKISLGAGKASSVGIHVGAGEVTGFIQQSTGTILEESLNPAFNIKSGLRSWKEK